MAETPSQHKEERVERITPDGGDAPTRSSFLSGVAQLEALDATGDFRRYRVAREQLMEQELSADERERLLVLDARHHTDPLARHMLGVMACMLVILALALWVF